MANLPVPTEHKPTPQETSPNPTTSHPTPKGLSPIQRQRCKRPRHEPKPMPTKPHHHVSFIGNVREPAPKRTSRRQKRRLITEQIHKIIVTDKFKFKQNRSANAFKVALPLHHKIFATNLKPLEVDTGTKYNILNLAYFNAHQHLWSYTRNETHVRCSTPQGIPLTVEFEIILNTTLNKETVPLHFLVISNLTIDGLLGRDFTRQTNAILAIQNRKMYCSSYHTLFTDEGIQELPRETEYSINELCQLEHIPENTEAIPSIQIDRMNNIITSPIYIKGKHKDKFYKIPATQITQDEHTHFVIQRIAAQDAEEWVDRTKPDPIPPIEELMKITSEIKQYYPDSMLNDEESTILHQLLERYPSIQWKEGLIPQSSLPLYDIDTIPGREANLRSQRAYNLSDRHTNSLKHHMNVGLKSGLYRRPKPGEKIITSPAFIKDEPGKEHGRPCIAYMHINDATMNNGYPIRDQEKLIRKMRRKYSLILDLKTGYHAIGLTPHAASLMAISTQDGVFVPTRMTFGSKNAPAHFCSCTDYVLKDIDDADVYIDDVNTANDHFRDFILSLATVFTQLKRYNLQFSRKKLQVCAKVRKFLGWIYTWHEETQTVTVSPDPNKVKAIREYPLPSTPTELKRFLGKINYLTEGIPKLAELLAPLSEALKKGRQKLMKTPAYTAQFQLVRDHLANTVERSIFLPGAPTYLRADTSKIGTGAVLCQIQQDKEVPIAFYSKKLTDAQSNYDPASRELLGIYLASRHFRHFMTPGVTTIFTDNTNVKSWVQKSKEQLPRNNNYLDYICSLCCPIVYRPGKSEEMAVPDALSRMFTPLFDTENAKRNFIKRNSSKILTAPALQETVKKVVVTKAQHVKRIQEDPFFGPIYTYKSNLLTEQGDIPPYIADPTTLTFNVDAPKYPNFFLENGYLYHGKFHDDKRHLCIPKTMQHKLIDHVHDQAHFGHQKVTAYLKDRFYFNNMAQVVKRRLASCHACQVHKTKLQRFGFFKSRQFSTLFECISLDVLKLKVKTDKTNALEFVEAYNGQRILAKKAESILNTLKLNPNKCIGRQAITRFKQLYAEHQADPSLHFVNDDNPHRFQHILVIMEEFSKFVLLEPIKDESIQELRRVVHDQVIHHWGPPKFLLHDEHKSFTGQQMKDLRQGLGIENIHTVPRQPTNNASNERSHSTIINALRTLMSKEPDKWASKIKPIQYAMNTFRTKSLPFSPYQVLFGKQPENDYIRALYDSEDYAPDQIPQISMDELNTYEKHIQQQRINLAEIHDAIRKKAVEHANKTRKPQNFKVGDFVVLIDEWERQNKLFKKLHGPYKVMLRHDDNHYNVRVGDTTKRYNVYRMRPYIARETTTVQHIHVTSPEKQDLHDQKLLHKRLLPIIKHHWNNASLLDLSLPLLQDLRDFCDERKTISQQRNSQPPPALSDHTPIALPCPLDSALPAWTHQPKESNVNSSSLFPLICTDFIGTGAQDPYSELSRPTQQITEKREITQVYRNHFVIVPHRATNTFQLGKIVRVPNSNSNALTLHLYATLDHTDWYQRKWEPTYSSSTGCTIIGPTPFPGTSKRICTIPLSQAGLVFDSLVAGKLPSQALRYLNGIRTWDSNPNNVPST